MRFVDGKECQSGFFVQRFQQSAHAIGLQRFGCNVEQRQRVGRRGRALVDGIVFRSRLGAANARRRHPAFLECLDLIQHQRNQWTNHNRDSSQQTGRQLITERFSSSRCQDYQLRFALKRTLDHPRL